MKTNVMPRAVDVFGTAYNGHVNQSRAMLVAINNTQT